jgi:hypothetical protein
VPRLLLLRNAQAELLNRDDFLRESELQTLLETKPELIALEDADPTSAPMLAIGSGVRLDGRAADLLYVDTAGRLTLIEVKLWRNPESRRKVVAQILEYGAYLSQWTLEKVEEQATDYLGGPDKLYGALSKLASNDVQDGLEDDEWTVDGFKEMVADNLLRHHIRLIIAVDGVIDPLRRIVTFINSSSQFTMFLLEVEEHRHPDGMKIASINIYGGSPTIRPQGSRKNEERLRAAIRDLDPSSRDVAEHLLEFLEKEADSPVWLKSLSFGLDRGNRFALFYVTSRHIRVLKGRVTEELGERGEAFLETLRSLGGAETRDRITVDFRALAEGTKLESFKKAVLTLSGAAPE